MYLGVDYYPEHWDINMIDSDMSRIKRMGANVIRIGEFAWHLIESEEGKYNFSFFDCVIEKAKNYNLKIIFGTPTATFPAWLSNKYPDILSENIDGTKRNFGGRRQYCFNSNIYIEHTQKIITAIAEHYKKEENIIAWQIDNELGHEGSDFCYCQQCHKSFQKYLQRKYKDIKTLNKIYGTIFWGQTYNNFNEIPLPKNTITTHNPSLQLDWARFRSFSINSYAKMQIELIKKLKGEHQSVTHNFPGGFFDKCYDYNDMAKELDFAAYDNYPVWGGLAEPIAPANIAMNHDYVRGLKQKNYWILEELMGAQGHTIIGYLPRPEQAKMWSYQAVAHGCNNLLYFRWRSMNRGAEQYCLGIIDHDDKEGRKYNEVQSFFKDISQFEDVVNAPIESDVAILYSFDNIWSWRYQPQSSEFNFNREILRLYEPFYNYNTHIDIISIDKDFRKYKVLVIPVMKIIDEELGMRLDVFARSGGVVVFSFRSGIKDSNNNIHFGKVIPCNIQTMCGIEINEFESLQEEQKVEIVGDYYYKGITGSCEVWRDLIVPRSAETLFKYNDEFYRNNACITVNNYGDGKVYYIGGGVCEDILNKIVKNIILENNIEYVESEQGIEVYKREFGSNKYLFIMNHTCNEKKYDNITLRSYQSRIVKLNN
jgi:beta-galactosidase